MPLHCGRVPEKIDIGPLYNVDPQRRAAYGAAGGAAVFAPVERELVFDVDMTDYDDVRTCCQGADICRSCWPLMTLAVKARTPPCAPAPAPRRNSENDNMTTNSLLQRRGSRAGLVLGMQHRGLTTSMWQRAMPRRILCVVDRVNIPWRSCAVQRLTGMVLDLVSEIQVFFAAQNIQPCWASLFPVSATGKL